MNARNRSILAATRLQLPLVFESRTSDIILALNGSTARVMADSCARVLGDIGLFLGCVALIMVDQASRLALKDSSMGVSRCYSVDYAAIYDATQ